jgi:DNA-binding response OmpR family regulator
MDKQDTTVDKPLILIVDDEKNFRDTFRARLAAAGFRTEIADSGEAAIMKADQAKPSLILTEVILSGMEGPMLILKLRENPKLADVKVAFLTKLPDPLSAPSDFHDRLAREFGAVQYFRKTDDLDVLVARTREIVEV